ncbi:MAG: adenylyl-sulfate kinase [Verrucomicrobia bacterium]|nr:MAG: adenylyl-sulfate kinase [Verrucomicrobiota bacterium]
MSKRQSSTVHSISSVKPPASSGEATLRVVFVGHVDHGKSTLIGRILSDTNSLPEGKLEQVQRACAAENMEFEFAFLLDALLEEQEQNITIDTTQIPFKTAKRNYMIIDAPGHKEFLKNMITGASSADAAVLVIAANEGVQEQSKRHAYLLSLLGVRQFCVVVNKMDLADYSEARFLEIEKKYRVFLKTLNLETDVFIPASARFGENITARSTKMKWHHGPTLAEALDAMTPMAPPTDLPLRLCVQDVYKFDDRRIIAGRIETGMLQVGDELVFSPANKTSIVQSIEYWPVIPSAVEGSRGASFKVSQRDPSTPLGMTGVAGDSIGITLHEQIFVERGYVASHSKDAPIETNRFHADLFWIARQPARLSHLYTVRLATQEVKCQIVSLDEVMDSSSLERNPTKADQLARNEVGRLTIQTRAPIVLDNHDRLPPLGRFVLVDDGVICGGGIVYDGVYTDRGAIKSKNIFWSEGKITAQARGAQHGHRGAVVWLTGLSGSGKSTIAQALERELFIRAMHPYVLDGDNIRHGLNSNLGFAPEDRVENIRRVSEVAKLMADAGNVVITAFISPYRADRQRARSIAMEGNAEFIEVFVDAPLEVCEERDPKNLYKKARAGEIREFTGIDAPYESPVDPEIVVQTNRLSVEESVASILERLLPRLK